MSAKSSLKALNELLAQTPSHDDVINMLGQLKSEDDHASDRAAAIVGAVLIEHGLKIVILSEFIKLNNTETKDLFDLEKGGQLGTFGARIRMSYAMGLIGRKTRGDLKLVLKIRNGFAHSALKLDFGLAAFSDLCKQFVLIDKNDTRTAKAAYIETVAHISGELQKKIAHDIEDFDRTSFLPGYGYVTMSAPKPAADRSHRFLP